MNKTAILRKQAVPYTVRTSNRARYMRLAVYPGGRLVVTVPTEIPFGRIEEFVTRKADWILKTVRRLSTYTAPVLPRRSAQAYAKNKMAALEVAQSRVAHFNAHYKLSVGNLSIRNQKTRWGSCSKKGNLSFNYKIALLPSELADYLVVHELCHIQEFNHGKKFWALVAETIPDYKIRRQQLKAQ